MEQPCHPFKPTDLWFDLPWAVWDTETTGLNPSRDRIVEVAVVHLTGGMVTERWSALIDPGIEISKEVAAIHGINNEFLKKEGAKPFREVVSEFISRLTDRVQVGYNALTFDREFMRYEIHACGLPFPYGPLIDPLIWIRSLDRFVKGPGRHKLGVTAERWGIKPTGNLHRATADAEVTCHLLRKIADRIPPTLGEVIQNQETLQVQQEKDYQAWKAKQPRRG